MAQLIQMRQRIKAIETIKKITHAMRLISMSSHSRLKNRQEPLKVYKDAMNNLFAKVHSITPQWHNAILFPKAEPNNILIILVGSYKGLCGSFNSALFHYFQRYQIEHNTYNARFIVVGKRAIEYVKQQKESVIVASYDEINNASLLPIAHAITNTIMTAQKPFSRVIMVSNVVKSFFMQKPQAHILIPFASAPQAPSQAQQLEEYIWEEQPQELLDALAQQCLDAHIQYLLFESLLAEHAARFLSMDNSTRNAQNLLETTQLDYNKLRQAKITKELTELTGSF